MLEVPIKPPGFVVIKKSVIGRRLRLSSASPDPSPTDGSGRSSRQASFPIGIDGRPDDHEGPRDLRCTKPFGFLRTWAAPIALSTIVQREEP